MTSRVVQTTIEPSFVAVPMFRTGVFTATTRAVLTFTTPATKTTKVAATSTVMAAATGSPASLPTSTGIPPLPSAFDSPLATGKDHTPAVAIVTLVAVIICGLILLLALGYFIFLRVCGKCPNCPQYEDEIKKYKNGSLKYIDAGMVRERVRLWDEEKGPMGPIDQQAHMHKVLMRQQSLACLEGRTQDQAQDDRTLGDWALKHLRKLRFKAAKGRTDSGWSSEATIDGEEEPKDFGKEKEQVNKQIQPEVDLLAPVPAHLAAAVTQLSPDDGKTLVNPALRNPEFNKTYSTYKRDVVALRKEEQKVQEIAAHLDIASDPNNRESVQVRAAVKAKAMTIELDTNKAETNETMTTPRQVGESRFKEHLSWATKSYKGSI